MNRVRATVRRLTILALSAGLWVSTQSMAWAQGQAAEEPPQYVVPYAIVILGLILGLLTVLNPTRRREKPREDEFVEKKDKKKG